MSDFAAMRDAIHQGWNGDVKDNALAAVGRTEARLSAATAAALKAGMEVQRLTDALDVYFGGAWPQALRRATRTTGGLFHKYDVSRRDGKETSWCFVLEPGRDPLAVPALRAYAGAAEAAGYSLLADDLRATIAEREPMDFTTPSAALTTEEGTNE